MNPPHLDKTPRRPIREADLRYERPSPHETVRQMAEEARVRGNLELQRASAQATGLEDAIGCMVNALADRRGPKEMTSEEWVRRTHGAFPYTDAVSRKGSAYEGPAAPQADRTAPANWRPSPGEGTLEDKEAARKAQFARGAAGRASTISSRRSHSRKQ